MSTPLDSTAAGEQPAAAASPTKTDADGMTDIPRRLMRVKVLYTFDDQNKSNCLARLPNALSIPTVSLNETTQVGVIGLKTCIQAIVAASPELVAKLGHDYTVYAFDYSEYETPLVGQGMLSWILASASMTPNAPAEQSQTMVTGRVCKNILGIFTNGVKETLEVKLKLVPVPTCLQSEYVENMERYHNLSKLLPEGLPDYNAWAQFLEANPAIRQLAQPPPIDPTMSIESNHVNGLESMQQMLARQSPSENAIRFDSFQDQHMSFNTYDTRASSPAMSTASFYQYPFQDARPDSRASFHSESAAYSQFFSSADMTQEQQEQEEEGPPKKRARVTQAKRPRKTALSANKDSLRVTASTAASVRLHKPAAQHVGAAVSIEQVPRAPTPRPGNVAMPFTRGPLRPVAPSLLRHASVDDNRPYVSPYEPGLFSDAAQDSADDERGCSPGDTPMNMPSSPPVLRTASSSPDLPSLPIPNDSGFVSDIPGGREEDDVTVAHKSLAETDEAPRSKESLGKTQPSLNRTQSQPIPQVPQPERDAAQSSADMSTLTEEALLRSIQGHVEVSQNRHESLRPNALPYPGASFSQGATHDTLVKHAGSTDNMETLTKKPRPTKARGLERSQTWSGEPMSDAAGPADDKGRQPRSGSGARRRHVIKKQLEQALNSGKMPQYCNHCGQIETPAWRKAYTRVEYGSPEGIQLSSKGTDICALEPMAPEEGDDGTQRYRIFKQGLTVEEYDSDTFTTLTLCNPCGLWLGKRNAMRPAEVWMKAQAQAAASANGEKPKRKRKPKKPKGENDDVMSDAVIPDSECAQPDTQEEVNGPSPLDGATDAGPGSFDMQPLTGKPTSTSNSTEASHLDGSAAQAALSRALKSSPAGLRGTKDSPIDVSEDLTPKPTRRVLFPSPRRSGEMKSLDDARSFPSMTRPEHSTKTSAGTTTLPGMDFEEVDKENCPPANEDDGLSHLFDELGSSRTTPTKSKSLEDLLKTPTPASRRRVPFTPKRGGDVLGLITPSRILKTPRTAVKTGAVAPETPFTRQLNALLSDCMASSPSQVVDFSDFPTFNTPGRTTDSSAHFGDLLSNEFLSSDLPIPSSPSGGLNFSVFEDPNTNTVGLWSGASIFEGNGTGLNDRTASGKNSRRASIDAPELKMNDISVDFSALLEGVVGNANQPHGSVDQSLSIAVKDAADGVKTKVVVEHSKTPNGTANKEMAGQEHSGGKQAMSPCGVQTDASEGQRDVEASTESGEKPKSPVANETAAGTIAV